MSLPNLTSTDIIKLPGTDGAETLVNFRELVELINEGVYCGNADGKIVYANTRFCENFGFTKEEIEGLSLFALAYDEESQKVLRTKMELRKKGVSDTYDIRMKKKDGSLIWLRVNGKAIFDSKKQFVGTISIHTEITHEKNLEEEVIAAKEDLEVKVITRTRQLSEANQKLYEQVKERRLAEISLKNSEKRFRDIYINSPDAIYVESFEGVILDVNEATCKLHHQTEDYLIGKSIYDVSPVEMHQIIRERQPKIISGEITKFESECLTKEGAIIPIEISAAPIQFKEQTALLMHVRDISDRKHNQELLLHINTELEEKVKERTKELQELNNRMQKEMLTRERMQKEIQSQKNFLRLIIDSTPNLIFVKDTDGKFLLANESVARFYNMKASEMEGHYDTEHNFTSDDLSDFKKQDEEVLSKNGEVQFPEQKFVDKVTGKITWLQTVKKPIASPTGGNVNILGVSTDITAIKEAKEELKVSEQLYREIARNLPNAAMFIFDKDLKYILAEGPLVGIISKPKNEIEGKSVTATIRESERARVEKIYRNIIEGEESAEEQVFLGRQLKVYHIPIRNDKNEIIYGMVMVFDISDLKEVQIELEKRATQLQRSNDELERFAYVASHDLQGPLRTIASYLQLLQARYHDKLDKEAGEFIDFSVSGAKRMQSLILDLLNYSRISSAPKPFVRTDVNEVVKNVLNAIKTNISANGAEVIVEPLPRIFAEPSQLFQLFQNLIDNGIKFVKGKKPVIHVSATEQKTHWEFAVSDNGIGIREDFKQKVFEIFQRLHSESEYEGTGVGLAICKKIVELHGGKIWFESSPGAGTTFRFTIAKNFNQKG